MQLGYNTNGLAHHEPLAALELIAETGYQCVAITLDHFWLNPFAPHLEIEKRRFAERLNDLKLGVVIETGARFLLDPRRKHFPSLVASPEVAAPRVDLIQRACRIAENLGGSIVSIWSGAGDSSLGTEQALDLLAQNLGSILRTAEAHDVTIGFEPEPGMFIDTLRSFSRLLEWIDHPRLKLTLDVGHLFCQGELPIADHIHRWSDRIVNVHIEDMRADVHEHLMFGDGEIRFPPVIEALQRVGYFGPLCVELSRHSHDGVNALQRSFDYLHPLISRI